MTHLRHLAFLLACIVSLGIAPASAQDQVSGGAPPAAAEQAARIQGGIDYVEWERTASRSEEAIENGRASNRAMEQLRVELSSWREVFLQGQTFNSDRVTTVREQIAALGPAPVDGGTEARELAERRSQLLAQLDALLAPGIAAEEAYSRADGMIREIDTLIRARQTDALLELGPSPLRPVTWSRGGNELLGSFRAIYNEIRADWQNQLRRAEFHDNLPIVGVLLLVGGVLILRGRRWTIALTNRLYDDTSSHSRRVMASLSSLTQIFLPFVGIVALTAALQQTELMGLRTSRIVALVPLIGLIILLGAWLAGRVFPRQGSARPILNLEPEKRAAARFDVTGLATLYALTLLLRELASYDAYSPEALAALRFLLVLPAGIFLFRVGRILLQQEGGEDDPRPYRTSFLRQLGRVTRIVSVVAPVLAIIGYSDAAYAVIFPMILTLAVMTAVATLQRFVVDLYVLGAGDNEGAGDNLSPVLLSFAVSIASVPVLALVWGARVADLTEVWSKFIEGIDVGGTHISPSNFITFAAVFGLAYTATRLLQTTLRSSLLPRTGIDLGGQNAIVAGTGYVGVVLAAVLAITAAGIDLSSIAIVAGALSVGIGFGLQTIVSNFVAGIILLIERPVREGDWIEVGGVMGTVRDISVRSTRIETFDRTDVIVPNSDLISNHVTNWTKHNLSGRLILTVGVAYGSDTKQVEQILRDIGEAHPLVIITPPPLVVFKGFGADSLDFELRVILRDINFGLSARTQLNHEIARRFQEEGLEIPFAQRDIWLRNPEALAQPAKGYPTPVAQAPSQNAPDFDQGPQAGEDEAF